jgi:hypothetical protein
MDDHLNSIPVMKLAQDKKTMKQFFIPYIFRYEISLASWILHQLNSAKPPTSNVNNKRLFCKIRNNFSLKVLPLAQMQETP